MRYLTCFFLVSLPFSIFSQNQKVDFPAPNDGCLTCHQGIEPIRQHDSKMMMEIYRKGAKANDPNGCVVCHGGNATVKNAEQAHFGSVEYLINHDGPKTFYPDPGSSWINENTCGQCHQEQVSAQMNSLMMTEQGKIQGTLWGFGGMEGYRHDIGNYVTSNPDSHERLGTDKYRNYMEELQKINPMVYPDKMTALPPAPTTDEVERNPQLAAYTYLRQECQRCHTGSKGRQKRGDFRGIGCSSCHIPYSNDGYYEGSDPTIKKSEQGHLLVHSIQASRKAKVTVGSKTYSGIPVETCTTCHNRGKRIGVSYQGLMETEYSPTFDHLGEGQPKLHTKHYIHLQEDVHYQKGMLCQDCHTSNDLHGDGFLSGTTLAPVEIECQDCHGTTKKFPWELPLGYSDEFDIKAAEGGGRGVASELPDYLGKGTIYNPHDGFLVTARGNPYSNGVKTGDSAIVHLASGKDIVIHPLKKLSQENKLSMNGRVAMEQVDSHMERLECYACHATWAPQCYGCHVKVDYSKAAKNIDWLKAATDRSENGLTGDARENLEKYMVDGEVSETRSYLRWEDPPLSQNGEGRISPTIPGCQTTITVIGKDGNALLENHIFRIPNVEGAGEEGQLGIDMSPVQPHTIQKTARTCESCHVSEKALGYGIKGGKYYADPREDLVIDLMTADGEIIPENVTVQKPGIKNLEMDWSRYVTEEGKQLQTVGHHFELSGPLDSKTRAVLDRQGVCLSCHQSIPDQDLAVSLMSHTAQYAGITIDNETHQGILHKFLLFNSWGQLILGFIVGVGIVLLILRLIRKK